jgi:D-amino peptidase
MTREINICAAACKEAGAEKVYVRDVHGGSYTVLWDELSSDIDVVTCGWTGTKRFPGIENCDGVILLGYHAMAGSVDSLLEHTMCRHWYRRILLNDTPAGEALIDGAILGEYNKPVIMVSGSRDACAQAKEQMPWITTAVVKEDAGDCGALLLSPAKSEACIRQAVATAVDALKSNQVKPLTVAHPVTFTVECTKSERVPSSEGKPYMTLLDDTTYSVTGDTVEETLWRIF